MRTPDGNWSVGVTFGFLARQRFDDLKIDVEDAIDGECAHINDVKLMTKIKSWRV